MKHQHGFTILELMIAIAIIGILATVVVPEFRDYVERSRDVEAITNVRKIADAAQMHYEQNRSLPISESGKALYTGSYKYGYGWGPSWVYACQNAGVVPRDKVDIYFRTLATNYVWDALMFYPEGQVRFSYYYYGWSYPNNAYAYIEAYRTPNCGAGGTYKWVYYRTRLLFRDGGLRKTGVWVQRT